jgi:hypothetical protein
VTAANLKDRLRASGYGALRERLATDAPAERGSWGADMLFRSRYACYLVLEFDEYQAFALAMASEVTVVDTLRLIDLDCPHAAAVDILV